jgi:hypothetical protein
MGGMLKFVWQVKGSTHWPAEQKRPLGHTVPQPPQLRLSLAVGRHWPWQSVWPAGQVQVPLLQTCPMAQARPQLPQFAASLAVGTHEPAHNC